MESIGEGLSPIPFITASYGLAALLLAGMAVWLILHRKQLESLKAAMQNKRR